MTISKIAAICGRAAEVEQRPSHHRRFKFIAESVRVHAHVDSCSRDVNSRRRFHFVCDWKVPRRRELSLTRKQVFWLRDLSDAAMVWMLRQVALSFLLTNSELGRKKQLHDGKRAATENESSLSRLNATFDMCFRFIHTRSPKSSLCLTSSESQIVRNRAAKSAETKQIWIECRFRWTLGLRNGLIGKLCVVDGFSSFEFSQIDSFLPAFDSSGTRRTRQPN